MVVGSLLVFHQMQRYKHFPADQPFQNSALVLVLHSHVQFLSESASRTSHEGVWNVSQVIIPPESQGDLHSSSL